MTSMTRTTGNPYVLIVTQLRVGKNDGVAPLQNDCLRLLHPCLLAVHLVNSSNQKGGAPKKPVMTGNDGEFPSHGGFCLNWGHE